MVVVDSFVRYLITEKRYSPHTVRAYQNDLMQFQEFIGERGIAASLTDCTTRQVRSWVIALLDGGLSPRSVNRKTTTLRRFYRFCQQEGIIRNNPAEAVLALKTDKPLPLFVDETRMESVSLQAGLPVDFPSLRNLLIVELLYGTGMRLAELIGLKETDADTAARQVKVLGKRQKERIIPVTEELAGLMECYRAVREQEFPELNPVFLILTNSGQPAYPKLVYRAVEEALESASVSGRKSPHVLRHTYATHLLNRGAELNAIKELLGHASLGATQVYTHTGFEKLKSEFRKAHPRA